MPAACNKCRTSRPLAGDTWCVGCGAWEVIGQELCGSWQGPGGLKEIANDLVLSTARSIRALRSVGAGVHRASAAPETAAVRVPEPITPPKATVTREAGSSGLVPEATSKCAPIPREKESEYTYTDGEESGEEEKGTEVEKKDPRPSLPRRGRGRLSGEQEERHPAVKREESEESKSERRRARDKRLDRSRSDRKKGGKEKKRDRQDYDRGERRKKKKKRGGRKHQRLRRLAEQPYLQVHRRLPSSLLDARPEL